MGRKASRCNKTSTPPGIFTMIPSLKGWSTKATEATSLCEVRLTQLDTNPVFQCLREEKIVQKNFYLAFNFYMQ